MPIRRREFLCCATLAAGATLLTSSINAADATSITGIKAVAFDAFPIFDPRPIFALAEDMFPGKGNDFSAQWRNRQFEYTWLRVIMGQYMDFWAVTQDALKFAAKAVDVKMTPNQQQQLMEGYLKLKVWPDVFPVLNSLKSAGLKIGFLSNFTPQMLQASIQSAHLVDRFDFVISTDEAKTFKPDPRAYELGTSKLKLTKEEILFVAFAGWDAAGAKMFGYPTYWVNRLKLPAEELGVSADVTANHFADLPQYLGLK